MFGRPRTLRAATTLMAAAALALAGCLVPDDDELAVKVKDDMTFASTFESDLINALAPTSHAREPSRCAPTWRSWRTTRAAHPTAS